MFVSTMSVPVSARKVPYSISQEICTRFLLCCGYTLTDFPISIRLTSLALWQSNGCPSASKVTLMNMDKYFMWIHHERLHNHNKAKHNKTVCIFLGIYCIWDQQLKGCCWLLGVLFMKYLELDLYVFLTHSIMELLQWFMVIARLNLATVRKTAAVDDCKTV